MTAYLPIGEVIKLIAGKDACNVINGQQGMIRIGPIRSGMSRVTWSWRWRDMRRRLLDAILRSHAPCWLAYVDSRTPPTQVLVRVEVPGMGEASISPHSMWQTIERSMENGDWCLIVSRKSDPIDMAAVCDELQRQELDRSCVDVLMSGSYDCCVMSFHDNYEWDIALMR